MSGLTVVVAPGGRLDGVSAALTDLSAAGLLAPFAWLSDPGQNGQIESVTVVESGVAHDVSLTELVTRQRTSVLRVCSLVSALGSDEHLSIPVELGVVRDLSSTTAAQRVVRIRCIVAGPGGLSGDLSTVAVEGWHNIVVSPEDSRGPDFGRVETPDDPSAPVLGRYAAPVVAGLCGLWNHLDHAPLDDAPVLPGRVVRLARSYFRRLDTDSAETALRRELVAQGGQLPLPADQRTQVVYIDDIGLAGNSMATALWRKYAGVLRGPRVPYESSQVESLTAWAAIKLFFGFLWASIKNAPSAWYNRLAGGVASRVAAGVQQAVFTGAPAAYEVVVSGRRPDGTHASWLEIGAASEHLSGAIAGPELAHEAMSNLSGVWQDYTRAALTLSDAGMRATDLPPVMVGAARGIIRRAADVVPGPAQRFTAIPGVVAAAVERNDVDATDPLEIEDLRTRLVDLQRRPDLGLTAGATLSSLDEWQRENSRSFGVAVGQQLAAAFRERKEEVRFLLDKLRNEHEPPDPGARNLRLARWVQVLIFLMLVTAGVFTYLAIAEIVEWWIAVCVVVGFVLISMIALAVAFINTQRQLFALIHQRKSVISNQQIDHKNLMTALADLRRLSQAYSQYLSWSRAVGSFLSAPLGPDTRTPAVTLPVVWGMPMSTAVGVATPNPEEIGTTAGYLRRDLFHPGWLTAPWDRLVVQVSPALPQQDPSAAISRLWSDRGRKSGSGLDRWSSALFAGEVTSSGADLVWDRALELLEGSMAGLAAQLTGNVAVVGGSMVPFAEFLGGLAQPVAPTGSFPTTLLTDTSIAGSKASVATDFRRGNRIGLGLVCAATQLSDALAVENLVTREDRQRVDVGWDAPPVVEPGRARPERRQVDPSNDEFRAPEPGAGFEF